jgi:hypothetical protein
LPAGVSEEILENYGILPEHLWYNRVRQITKTEWHSNLMQRTQFSFRLPNRSTQNKSKFPIAVAFLYLPALLLVRFGCLHAGPQATPSPNVDRISAIMNELRSQLQMSQDVHVTVATNDRMVSVERVGKLGMYIMCFDEHFLADLDSDELRAAIAHELGHVWIFSHHPYLQTEALANEIAMKAVTRESLEKVYKKLWTRLGTSGNLDDLLGPERVQAQR